MPCRISRFVASVLATMLAIAGAAFSSAASAQNIAAPPAASRVGPQLVIAGGAEQPVRLQQVTVRSEVSGRLAVTEIAMHFHNPNNRILEGELQFPLLDGQQILGFSMDVNGRLREAVPVEKARGQAVFEDITRVRIDPGLLEVTQGNNFKLRVYPLPPHGVRQVVLRVSETLREKAGKLVYRLPLEYAATLERFRLDINVAGARPLPAPARGGLDGLTFTATAGGYHAGVARERYAGRGVLELELQPVPGAHAYTQPFDGRHYFFAEVAVPVRTAVRTLPKTVGILWDASGSGATRDHVREFALLDAYFRRLQNGEVRLTILRDSAESGGSFRIVNGNWQALRDTLQAVPYDGATNLGAFAADAGVGEYLLFSDGLGNFGDRPYVAPKQPVYAISAAMRSDPARLRQIAEAGGARFIDLLQASPAVAAARLLSAVTRISVLAADGATQVQLDSPYPSNGRAALSGILTESATRVRLGVVHPDAQRAIIEVPVRAGDAPFAMVAALWARMRIEALEAQYDLNRAEIRRLGQRFGLVTRETSLIVLDRIEDYVRFEIEPPSELRTDYERLRLGAARQRGAETSAHLEAVVRRFQEKVTWWNRDFPQGAKPAPQQAVTPVEGARGRTHEMDRRDAPARNQVAPAAAAPEALMLQRREAGKLAGRAASADALQPSVAPAAAQATITLKKWEPDAPYATRMRNAAAEHVYRVYLDERAGYLNSTAFFLDAADILFERQQPALAVRVLSNLAEMDLENRHILRVLGHRLLQIQQVRLALPVFRKVLELSPEEPQSYRDLGLAYAADRQWQKAVDTLYAVVVKPWHGRFPDVEIITLADLNAIVAAAPEKPDTSRIDPRLLKNLPLDLRVVLTWDADNTDIDLWVTDPNGERAYYGNRLTYQGGRMSLDFTGGYGPEEFSLKRAKPGQYKVEAQYFGDRQQKITGPTTLQVTLTTQFGSAAQKEQAITLRLKGRSETVFVGTFEVK
jgi:Ca-activated chloride channel family protein